MGVQMFVCLSVCLLVCGGQMEIQTLAPILMKFCTHIPIECFVPVWPPLSLPPGPGGLETLKLKDTFFYKIKDVQQVAN